MEKYSVNETASKEERETIAVYEELTDTWSIYSNVRKHITKLTKIFGEDGFDRAGVDDDGRLMEVSKDGVEHGQVSFRNKKKPMSEEQRAKAAERMRKMHQDNS